jgi:hypothetical protein
MPVSAKRGAPYRPRHIDGRVGRGIGEPQQMFTNPVPSSPQGLDAAGELESFPVIEVSAAGVYQRLRIAGLTDAQAGDLTARASGLRITRHPWRIEEIQRLLFLRSLVDDHRIVP